ncbi:hypothetical protein C8R43DRAFT_1039557 [Mycena crocata]|nr:hypothetical protein C8R43DRAFT_1039557 [Mycena crocata]
MRMLVGIQSHSGELIPVRNARFNSAVCRSRFDFTLRADWTRFGAHGNAPRSMRRTRRRRARSAANGLDATQTARTTRTAGASRATRWIWRRRGFGQRMRSLESRGTTGLGTRCARRSLLRFGPSWRRGWVERSWELREGEGQTEGDESGGVYARARLAAAWIRPRSTCGGGDTPAFDLHGMRGSQAAHAQGAGCCGCAARGSVVAGSRVRDAGRRLRSGRIAECWTRWAMSEARKQSRGNDGGHAPSPCRRRSLVTGAEQGGERRALRRVGAVQTRGGRLQ